MMAESKIGKELMDELLSDITKFERYVKAPPMNRDVCMEIIVAVSERLNVCNSIAEFYRLRNCANVAVNHWADGIDKVINDEMKKKNGNLEALGLNNRILNNVDRKNVWQAGGDRRVLYDIISEYKQRIFCGTPGPAASQVGETPGNVGKTNARKSRCGIERLKKISNIGLKNFHITVEDVTPSSDSKDKQQTGSNNIAADLPSLKRSAFLNQPKYSSLYKSRIEKPLFKPDVKKTQDGSAGSSGYVQPVLKLRSPKDDDSRNNADDMEQGKCLRK